MSLRLLVCCVIKYHRARRFITAVWTLFKSILFLAISKISTFFTIHRCSLRLIVSQREHTDVCAINTNKLLIIAVTYLVFLIDTYYELYYNFDSGKEDLSTLRDDEIFINIKKVFFICSRIFLR